MPYTLTKLQLFLKLGKFDEKTKQTRFVRVKEFKGRYLRLRFGNGGSWCRRSNLQNYKLALIKNNGNCCCMWDVSEKEKTKIKYIFIKNCKLSGKGNTIAYLKIFGQDNSYISRPIRKNIRDYYKKLPCCVCGSFADLVCDHKNDLYNNPRVLNISTQRKSDFQSLCNHCNLQKRTVMVRTQKEKNGMVLHVFHN